MKDNPFRKAIASRKQRLEPIVADPIVADPILEEVILEEAIAADPILEKAIAADPIVAKPILEEAKVSTGIESLAALISPELEIPPVFSQPSRSPQAEPLVPLEPIAQPIPLTPANPSLPVVEPPSPLEIDAPKKRGRPATGKRSDGAWVGRTYYIRRETDLDIGEVILQLRRQGIEVDKSELVDLLLSAWVKWHKGENIEIQLAEISPIQK